MFSIGVGAAPLNADVLTPKTSLSMDQCKTYYQTHLRDPRVLNMAVVFGYSDTIDDGYDYVADTETKRSLVNQLERSCRGESSSLCGFTRQTSQGVGLEIFEKAIWNLDQQKILVRVYVQDSSVSNSNEANLSTYRTQQTQKSEWAKKVFGWGLTEADVVLYEGHSRGGGGPDFLPPQATASGIVNYAWYNQTKPGLKYVTEKLAVTGRDPMMIGLFSCKSNFHFRKNLATSAPTVTTILGLSVMSKAQTEKGLLLAMESILKLECPQKIQSRVQSVDFVVNQPLRL